MEALFPAIASVGVLLAIPLVLILLAFGTWSVYMALTGSFIGWVFVVCASLAFPPFFLPYFAICLPFAILARIFCPPSP